MVYQIINQFVPIELQVILLTLFNNNLYFTLSFSAIALLIKIGLDVNQIKIENITNNYLIGFILRWIIKNSVLEIINDSFYLFPRLIFILLKLISSLIFNGNRARRYLKRR